MLTQNEQKNQSITCLIDAGLALTYQTIPKDLLICLKLILLQLNSMQKQPLVLHNKSCKAYFLYQNTKVYFSGDFDNGNLEKAQQLAPLTYRLTPGYDKTRNTTHKNFFHFKVYGFKSCTVKFIVTRVHLLEQFIKDDASSDSYHPVVRRNPQKPFEKLRENVKIYYSSGDEPELSFSYTFDQECWVQFAFTYPYTYEDCEQLISKMISQYQNHKQIYFHDQVLIRTSETRKVHLLTITDRRNVLKQRQEEIQGIFGQSERPFKIDRPRVVISARVHPGETPASHCMEGVIRFLLNQNDYRSYLLRKYFHFSIIPMINPEGVYEGMFRNDLNGDNLNRHYLHCDRRRHKSILGIVKWLKSVSRVDFFFDLHAHPSRKGFFIYGNAFEEFLEQVEAQIFSKMLEYNCPYFQNLDCIYSEKAMTAKDKYDTHSKQGCARVYFHHNFKMIHSYTVQCGYFGPTKLNRYPPQRQFLSGSDYMCTEEWQKISMKQYSPQSYMFMGKSLLISILDLFHVNPYSRISTSDFKSVHSLRKFTAQRVYNQVERFRLIDSNCYKKIKEVATLIEQNYYIPRFKAYGLTINQNYGMRHRKKAFSLNTRLYQKSKKKSFVALQKNPMTQYQKKQEEKQEESKEHHAELELSRSEQSLLQIKQQSQHLLNTPSLPEIIQKKQYLRKFRVTKSSSLEALQKNKTNFQPSIKSTEELAVIVHAKFPFERLYQQKSNGQSLKKLQNQIIGQIMKNKDHKKEKKSNQLEPNKINRLEAFLKKESKVKFPFIHSERQEKTEH